MLAKSFFAMYFLTESAVWTWSLGIYFFYVSFWASFLTHVTRLAYVYTS